MLSNPSPSPTINVETVNAFDSCDNLSIDLLANEAKIILERNDKRTHACFVNNSGVDITLTLGLLSDCELNKGIILKPNGGSYVIAAINLYIGRVCAIASSDAVLSVVECENVD